MLVARPTLNVEESKGENKETLSLAKISNNSKIVPEYVESRLQKTVIDPIKKILMTLFQKIGAVPMGEKRLSIYIKQLQTNQTSLKRALNQLNEMEIQEEIVGLGLRGFHANLNLEGIQLDISSTPGAQEDFLQLIREYIFDYSEEWPPGTDKINYFQVYSPTKKICCAYWPLYGYVEKIFLEQIGKSSNITDLFLIKNMRRYCQDLFPPKPKQLPQKGGDPPQERKDFQGKRNFQNRKKDFQKRNFQNKKKNFQTKKDQNPGSPFSNPGGLKTTIFGVCAADKLKLVSHPLHTVQVNWKEFGGNISEYRALKRIVSGHVAQMGLDKLVITPKVSDVDQLIDFGKRVDLHVETFNKEAPFVRDPILGIHYSFSDLQKWFPYPKQGEEKHRKLSVQQPQVRSTIIPSVPRVLAVSGPTEAVVGVPPRGVTGAAGVTGSAGPRRPPRRRRRRRGGANKRQQDQKKKKQDQKKKKQPQITKKFAVVLPSWVKRFKQSYPLVSAMPYLEENVLTGVRRRLLKLLATLFHMMNKMYQEIIDFAISLEKKKKNTISHKSELQQLNQRLEGLLLKAKDPVLVEKLLAIKKKASEEFK